MDLVYQVICAEGCGKVRLSNDEYLSQMMRPDSFWKCPKCCGHAEFDDDAYEDSIDAVERASETTHEKQE